jgi:hypothetical protein
VADQDPDAGRDLRHGGTVALVVSLGPEPRTVVLPSWYLVGGHVGHGYALTVHKAQGATADRAWVYADPRTVSTEWLYTALSRHRDTAHLYTSITTLDDLAVDLEAHAPRADRLRPDETASVASLQAKAGRSQAKSLATDFAAPAPRTSRPAHNVPRPPAQERPQPIGLEL